MEERGLQLLVLLNNLQLLSNPTKSFDVFSCQLSLQMQQRLTKLWETRHISDSVRKLAHRFEADSLQWTLSVLSVYDRYGLPSVTATRQSWCSDRRPGHFLRLLTNRPLQTDKFNRESVTFFNILDYLNVLQKRLCLVCVPSMTTS